MDEEEAKNCPNCKREIPAVNFTIHLVHCARNIRMCPVCKEPVPSAELDEHHQKFHKLLPCKQCGESVCGTDLEDHIRDSCAHTIKTCRFCELELPRRELPTHEAYCGVRTEQCPECREWVMLKYRQLHLDSNHGFIRLDDDPAPGKKDPPKLNLRPARAVAVPSAFGSGPTTAYNYAAGRQNVPSSGVAANVDSSGGRAVPSASNAPTRPSSIYDDAGSSNFRNEFPRTQVRPLGSNNSGSSSSSGSVTPDDTLAGVSRAVSNGVKKRTNDQPQINTNKEVANKVNKDLAVSLGAVKKRPAPKPPRAAAPADPRRDLPFYSAMERQQREERQRREQNEYNLAHGLPPVLSPAAKIEKLRKLDALQNPDAAEELRGRRPAPDPRQRPLQDFRNLTPMSPEEFMARFASMQVGGAAVGAAGGGVGVRAGGAAGGGVGVRAGGAAAGGDGDRFREIKSSLQELRRGLNEVTAPYNNNNVILNNNNDRVPGSPGGPGSPDSPGSPGGEVRLPCEFCTMLVPADDLVQHQTGCRPDLAQYWRGEGARSPSPPPPPRAPSPAAAHAHHADPVIPCEFCAQSLPVYLITEHQERCAREVDILSAD